MTDKSYAIPNQNDLWRMANQSYFPILVVFDDTGEEVAFDAPTDIPRGRAFRILEHQNVVAEVVETDDV